MYVFLRAPQSSVITFSISSKVSASDSGTFSYRSLEVYLVSATTGQNITVSNGTQLLTQEPASTVKHILWPVPTCVQTGEYNVGGKSSPVERRPLTTIIAHCLRSLDPHQRRHKLLRNHACACRGAEQRRPRHWQRLRPVHSQCPSSAASGLRPTPRNPNSGSRSVQ